MLVKTYFCEIHTYLKPKCAECGWGTGGLYLQKWCDLICSIVTFTRRAAGKLPVLFKMKVIPKCGNLVGNLSHLLNSLFRCECSQALFCFHPHTPLKQPSAGHVCLTRPKDNRPFERRERFQMRRWVRTPATFPVSSANETSPSHLLFLFSVWPMGVFLVHLSESFWNCVVMWPSGCWSNQSQGQNQVLWCKSVHFHCQVQAA